MFTITASNVYGANQIKGAEEEAEKLGYKLRVFQNNFSQPEQDQQVQQYIASGAQPAAIIFWPWVADAAINDVRQLSKVAPVIQLTQEPNEQSWPYVKAYSGANQILIGKTLGDMLIKARDAAKAAGMQFKSPGGNLLVFQHPEGEKTGTERMKGFMEVTKDAPFNIIHLEYGAEQSGDRLRDRQPGDPEVQGPVRLPVRLQPAGRERHHPRAQGERHHARQGRLHRLGRLLGQSRRGQERRDFRHRHPAGCGRRRAGGPHRGQMHRRRQGRGRRHADASRRRGAADRKHAAGEVQLHAACAGDRSPTAWRRRRSGATPPTRSAPAEAQAPWPEVTSEAENGGVAERPRLSVRGVSKRYGNVQALAEVDFELRRGEVMALLGENGAGKSTLVKVLVRPRAARFRHASRSTGGQSTSIQARRSQAAGVAVVHQEYSSCPDPDRRREPCARPGRTAASLAARASQCARPQAARQLSGSTMSIPATPVEKLSVAEMQLLEIARLLVRDARILIFDEPTAALADREIERVLVGHHAARRRRPQHHLRHPPAAGSVSHRRPRDGVPQRPQPAGASRPPSSMSMQ